MDTDVWRTLTAAVRSADRRVPRGGRKMRFSDQQIVRMFLWCVWHDRPLCWACDPIHYTSRFRPWQLPSIAQFCRRVKSTRVNELLTAVNEYLVRRGEPTRIAVLDRKPLALKAFQAALAINPHLDGLHHVIEELQKSSGGSPI